MALNSLWIDFELSSKKFNGELGSSSSSVFVEWSELELTAEFNAVNWTWIELFELYSEISNKSTGTIANKPRIWAATLKWCAKMK